MALNRDLIAEAAFRVAARADSEALRIRDVGAELGTDPTAIYRHYRSRDEMLFDLVDRVAARVFDEFSGDKSPWRERLVHGANVIVDRLIDYPSVGIGSVRDRPSGLGELRLADLVLSTVLESGIDRARGVRVYTALTSFTLQSAAQLCAEKVADTVSATKTGRVTTRDSYNRTWVVPISEAELELVPTLAGEWTAVSALRRRDAFDAGLEAILDGIECAASWR